jgi:hypothetical protein
MQHPCHQGEDSDSRPTSLSVVCWAQSKLASATQSKTSCMLNKMLLGLQAVCALTQHAARQCGGAAPHVHAHHAHVAKLLYTNTHSAEVFMPAPRPHRPAKQRTSTEQSRTKCSQRPSTKRKQAHASIRSKCQCVVRKSPTQVQRSSSTTPLCLTHKTETRCLLCCSGSGNLHG